MLKKIRIALAVVFFLGITLLLLDITGALHLWLGWMARIQFLPAVMAVNLGVIIALCLLTLVFGRVYCSVICPLGVLQDGIARVRVNALRRRKNHKPYGYKKELKWLRYGIWALFVAALIAGIQPLVALLAPYSAFGRIVSSIFQPVYLWCNNLFAWIAERAGSYTFYGKEVWLKSLPVLLVAIGTLLLVGVLAWTGGRTYCNAVCPVGTTLSFLSRFAMFRPVIDKSKCKDCHVCEHNCKASCINIKEHKIDYSRCVDCFNCIGDCKFGALRYRFAWKPAEKAAPAEETPSSDAADTGRRAFMTGTAVLLGTTLVDAQEKKLDGGFAEILDKKVPERTVPITPFGSKSVKDFYDRCTACQLCVAACPNNVLRPSGSLEHFMQPEMSYERGYCRPECVRCAEVCPSGAILGITKEQKTEYRVGIARVNRDLCVVETRGTSCGNCARKCPIGAIRMVHLDPEDPESLLRPTVIEEKCIGCGACENLCPARPISAITVDGRRDHLNA
ncbi:MAG: 4Fe-4S dicluster domain-containing protein [Bacteroidales bacterium]|nr:4Fe-4S dicluster domain-containing protein [Bacteroidales bacterium]